MVFGLGKDGKLKNMKKQEQEVVQEVPTQEETKPEEVPTQEAVVETKSEDVVLENKIDYEILIRTTSYDVIIKCDNSNVDGMLADINKGILEEKIIHVDNQILVTRHIVGLSVNVVGDDDGETKN